MATIDYISNANQLNKELQIILDNVINIVANNLLNDFQEHLEKTIYAAPSGEYYKRYHKKGGFYSGWGIDATKQYIRTLYFDGSKLVSPGQDTLNGQSAHKGNASTSDVRDMMAGILNDYYLNSFYSENGGATYFKTESGKGYWTSYLESIDEKINKWLDDEFKKYGIVRGVN